jgi:hypothetical protein
MNKEMLKTNVKSSMETIKESYTQPAIEVFEFECEDLILSGSGNSLKDVEGENWESRVMTTNVTDRYNA